MTKDDILKELEVLKELTNVAGRQMVDGIKAGVLALIVEQPKVAEEKVKEVEVEKVEPAPAPLKPELAKLPKVAKIPKISIKPRKKGKHER